MAEAVVGDRSRPGLREQPCVWDAEQRACDLGVDQRCERPARVGGDLNRPGNLGGSKIPGAVQSPVQTAGPDEWRRASTGSRHDRSRGSEA